MDVKLAWLGLAISLGGPAILVLARRRGLFAGSPAAQRVVGAVGLWTLTGLVAVTLDADHRSFSSIGLGPISLASVGWGLAGGIAGILAFPLCVVVLRGFGVRALPADDMNGFMSLPLWTRLLTLVTAAVAEEILFRGYPMTTLRAISGGSLVLAILLPLAVFVIVHLPAWGWSHLVFVTSAGAILALLFVLRGSLWSNIIAHAVIDAVPLLLLPILVSRTGASQHTSA